MGPAGLDGAAGWSDWAWAVRAVRTVNKCINKDLVLIKSKQAISKRSKGMVSSIN